MTARLKERKERPKRYIDTVRETGGEPKGVKQWADRDRRSDRENERGRQRDEEDDSEGNRKVDRGRA